MNASLLQHWRSQLKSEGALACLENGRKMAASEEDRRLRKELPQARQASFA